MCILSSLGVVLLLLVYVIGYIFLVEMVKTQNINRMYYVYKYSVFLPLTVLVLVLKSLEKFHEFMTESLHK